MEQTDNCQMGEEREDWMKEGEGISQRTHGICMTLGHGQ